MPREWAALTVEKQRADPDSTLSFFRRALQLRREHDQFDGSQIDWLPATGDALVFRRRGGGLVCALNAGRHPTTLPPGELLMASGPLVDGQLPPDTAAWLV
ncbi:hypothetical protein NIIDMKKI_20550 [Mycobacterium kansasii]|nr:hypothetical protein NIIDMKKI_20550 [Mycobacterium kansasii]